MYTNVPEKMRRNSFKLVACPKNTRLYAQCMNLTLPKYPTGQTAFVDVDPVEALSRVSADDYAEYAQTEQQRELEKEFM